MLTLSPWTLARRAAAGRRGVLLFVLAALLYGFGMHAARACQPAAFAGAPDAAVVPGSPCHHGDLDVAQTACEAHCRTDAQSSRLSPSFDLPEAAPASFGAPPAPLLPAGFAAPDTAPQRRDTGPPLHILLHRLLR